MSDKFEEYRLKVAGTNIDQRSLLSTDYFNTFNSVAMVFDMLPDMPELLEEVDAWQFFDYIEHFRHSGLDFADLAIEAYPHAPADLRAAFESKVAGMRIIVEETRRTLHLLQEAGEMKTFSTFASHIAEIFHQMMDEGGAIIHGETTSLSQDSIDQMF
ncbi:MAG: hypothetical protein P4M15_01315 [Alphaproteobacteria bacterium]|nr:hypothetical protein [Alphaproteobacteria bacterium]